MTIIHDNETPYIKEIILQYLQLQFDKYYKKNRDQLIGMSKDEMIELFKIDYPSWEGPRLELHVFHELGGKLSYLEVKTPRIRIKKDVPGKTLLEQMEENGDI